MLNDHLEDIALFFNLDGQRKKCWVTKSVYTDPNRKVEQFDASWKRAVVVEGGEAGAPFHVTNLSKLQPPGVAPGSAQKKEVAPDARAMARRTPEKGDLVVIPYADPNSAFLIKKGEYQDPSICPVISEIEGADLAFLAVTQGVVLANLPKEDITGMTCYLLNLLALSQSG